MFRRLFKSLFGDFPPKNLPLCDKCRGAYTAVGIIQPPLPYNTVVEFLYSHSLLCPIPCGEFRRPSVPQTQQGYQALSTFRKIGMDCEQCSTALLTVVKLVQSVDTPLSPNDFKNLAYSLHHKNVVCEKCLVVFLDFNEDMNRGIPIDQASCSQPTSNPARFEAPPSDIELCSICTDAYKAAGIIKPAIPFKDLLPKLYLGGALCRNPCGGSPETLNMLPKMLPFESRFFHQTLRESGINCFKCGTSIVTCVTLSESISDMPSLLNSFLSEDLLCQNCHTIFRSSLGSLLESTS